MLRLIPTDVAPTIALASLAISVITGTVSFAAFRKGGPTVKVRCYAVSTGPDSATLELEVINTGRGDSTIDVDRLEIVWWYGDRRRHKDRFSPQFDGELPYRLPGNSSVRLTAPANELMKWAGGSTEQVRLDMKVGGRRRRVKIEPPHAATDHPRNPPHPPLA
ncbi:hypothetical protein [Streptomyces sp. NPDC005148]